MCLFLDGMFVCIHFAHSSYQMSIKLLALNISTLQYFFNDYDFVEG